MRQYLYLSDQTEISPCTWCHHRAAFKDGTRVCLLCETPRQIVSAGQPYWCPRFRKDGKVAGNVEGGKGG